MKRFTERMQEIPKHILHSKAEIFLLYEQTREFEELYKEISSPSPTAHKHQQEENNNSL